MVKYIKSDDLSVGDSRYILGITEGGKGRRVPNHRDFAELLLDGHAWPIGTRLTPRSGEILDVVAEGGHLVHPISGIRIEVVRAAPNNRSDGAAVAADTRLSYADGLRAGDLVPLDTGGALEVVAPPSGAVPKRMIQTARPGAPVTLKFAGAARMDITAFGARDGRDCTRAIDAAMAEAAYYQRPVAELATYPVTADGPAVYVPAGRFYYEGSGLDRSTTTADLRAKAFAIRGEHRGASLLINKSDCYLLKTGDVNSLTFEHFSLIGGKGLWVSGNTDQNVRGGIYANNLLIKNFTECALGHSSSDFPNIHVNHCQIEGLADTAIFGLCLSGLTDEVLIHNSTISSCRYGIKLGCGGNNAKITSNGLFVSSHPGGMSADIWIVPRGSETNAGQGLVIDKNKFGPEGIEDETSVRILFADEGPGTYAWQRSHSAAKSTGYAVGARISKNGFYGNARHGDRLIYSTTHRLNGLAFEEDNILAGFTGARPSKILEYSPEVLADYATGALQIRSGARMLRGTQGVITASATTRPSNMRGSNVPAMPDFGNGMEGSLDVARGWVGEPDVAEYTPILHTGAHVARYWAGAVTVTGDIDDPFGGTGAVRVDPATGVACSITLGNMRPSIVASKAPQGVTAWIELFARSQGGAGAFAGLVIGGSSYDRVVNFTTEGPSWQLIRFPVTLTRAGIHPGAAQIRMGIPANQAVNGQPVDFYGGSMYVARSPVNAGHLRARGAAAGGWNGPHLILGAHHLWVDAEGRLRMKSGAPVSDADGHAVGAPT